MDAKTAEKIMLASSVAIIVTVPTIAFIRGFKEKAAEIKKNRANKNIDAATPINS